MLPMDPRASHKPDMFYSETCAVVMDNAITGNIRYF